MASKLDFPVTVGSLKKLLIALSNLKPAVNIVFPVSLYSIPIPIITGKRKEAILSSKAYSFSPFALPDTVVPLNW